MDRSDGQVEPDRTSEPAENGSAAESASTASAASVKTPRGPVIVPTLIGLDGIKTLPRAFELCEVDELITLIGTLPHSKDMLSCSFQNSEHAGPLDRA